MATLRLGIKGIGPKKEQALEDAGFDTVDKIREAGIYRITEVPGFGFRTAYLMFEALGIPLSYPSMEKVEETRHEVVVVDAKPIKPWREHKSKKDKEVPAQPENFKVQRTTVWSFPKRGDWASHTPQYRGNWPPDMVRNILLLWSEEGDTVLDPMVGGGTTPVECLLTGRNSISVDVNPGAIEITRDRLDLPEYMTRDLPKTTHETYVGDVRNLDAIPDSSIDLIATHPPYVNIISYAPLVQGDLSQLDDYNLFFKEFSKAIAEMMRVLRPGGRCAILIGDTHNRSHFVPVSSRMLSEFLKEGFVLKEDVIKMEWNVDSNHKLAKYGDIDFLLTMHEHLYVFEKPATDKGTPRNSTAAFFGRPVSVSYSGEGDAFLPR